MSNNQNRLLVEIEKLSEYLVKNRVTTDEEVELFYEFCYNVLTNMVNSLNPDLEQQLIEEAISKVNLAFHGMVFGRVT